MFDSEAAHQWATPCHDEIQLALLNASQPKLKSVLQQCHPPIFAADAIKSIAIQGEVFVGNGWAADAVITFIGPACEARRLTDEEAFWLTGESLSNTAMRLERTGDRFVFKDFAINETRSYALTEGFYTRTKRVQQAFYESFNEAITHLLSLNYPESTLERLFDLPVLDLDREFDKTALWLEIEYSTASGTALESFRRQVRIGNNGNCFAVFYRDWVAPQCPVHFPDRSYTVVIEIKTGELVSFGATLRQINRYRERLKTTKAILFWECLTEAEAAAFRNQGISLYAANDIHPSLPANGDWR